MTQIFLTHTPRELEQYYGKRPLAALRELADVKLNHQEIPLSTEALIEAAAESAIIVCARSVAGHARVFHSLPKLLAFCRVAVDIRNIDVEAASECGVLVTRATPGFDASVAEWITAVMIDLARGISTSAAAFWQGGAPVIHMGRQLKGSCVGVVGLGFIGKYLVQVLRALGMQVLVADPHVQPPQEHGVTAASLDTLLANSDFVVCLAAALPDTENLFNQTTFARMKRGAFFINASRGELVDEIALLEALETHQIAGAAVDVGRALDQMPSSALAQHPHVIATPHIGGLTPDATEHQAMDTVRQVAAILAGSMPEHAVNASATLRFLMQSR